MTMQTPDLMIWKNVEYSIIAGLSFERVFPDTPLSKFEFMSTNCWRGYIETWIVDDDGWLKLSKIGSGIQEKILDNGYLDLEIGAVNQLDKIFPNYDGPITALGFSGDVTIGYGDVRSHGLYAVSYSNYRVSHFEGGKLTHFEEQDRALWEKDHEPYVLPDFLLNLNETD